MGQLTNFAEKKILDHILKTASYTPPSTVYLGLFSDIPGPGPIAPGTEVAYDNYQRVAISFGTAASRAIAQSAIVSFPQCGATPDIAYMWGLCDAHTGGNLLAYGALITSKQIVSGNTPAIGIGQITVDWVAGAFFTGLGDTILNWLFAAGSLAQPTHVKIGLSTSTPADDGSGITEPSGNNYSQVNFDTWRAAVTGSTTVNADSAAGQPVLNVASTTGFVVGGKVNIASMDRAESKIIASIQPGTSLTLATNLVYTHTALQADVVVSPETVNNNGNISMPTPSGSWGTVTYSILYLDTTPAGYCTVISQIPSTGDIVEWLDTAFVVSIQ